MIILSNEQLIGIDTFIMKELNNVRHFTDMRQKIYAMDKTKYNLEELANAEIYKFININYTFCDRCYKIEIKELLNHFDNSTLCSDCVDYIDEFLIF